MGSHEALLSHDGAFSKFLKTYHEKELKTADSDDIEVEQRSFRRELIDRQNATQEALEKLMICGQFDELRSRLDSR
ncbi:hypothetical protein DPMN_183732 [Dreissena polymorpha]|uniref:Uncharacterized protein n=1 Tax=Dreissena polymorpha TaxID=45954 RepID=A0A9D4DKG3_DREPO|nr:hypothetical protein DPMN_183732 [Dreissena polymorpha]